jgi:superfamily I DNA/RNA helicase
LIEIDRLGDELERPEYRGQEAPVKQAGVQALELSDRIEITPGKLFIGTMHLAKGLEFRAVAVMACNDERLTRLRAGENSFFTVCLARFLVYHG